MSAWAGRVATHYFTAVLAVQLALSGASLPVFAQDQQDQQQRQLTHPNSNLSRSSNSSRSRHAASPYSAADPTVGRANCALSGCSIGAGADCVDLSA